MHVWIVAQPSEPPIIMQHVNTSPTFRCYCSASKTTWGYETMTHTMLPPIYATHTMTPPPHTHTHTPLSAV